MRLVIVLCLLCNVIMLMVNINITYCTVMCGEEESKFGKMLTMG